MCSPLFTTGPPYVHSILTYRSVQTSPASPINNIPAVPFPPSSRWQPPPSSPPQHHHLINKMAPNLTEIESMASRAHAAACSLPTTRRQSSKGISRFDTHAQASYPLVHLGTLPSYPPNTPQAILKCNAPQRFAHATPRFRVLISRTPLVAPWRADPCDTDADASPNPLALNSLQDLPTQILR